MRNSNGKYPEREIVNRKSITPEETSRQRLINRQLNTTPETSEPETITNKAVTSLEVTEQEPIATNTADTIDKEKPHRKLPKGLVWVVVGVGAIAAGIFGYRWWHYASTHASTDDAYVAGHVHQISSRIPGTVTDVEVDDNQQVKQGKLLVKLDPKDLQVEVEKAQAALLTAQSQAKVADANIGSASDTAQAKSAQAQGDISDATANVSTAKAAVSGAKAKIASAQAQVAQADADLNQTQKDYERYSNLYKEGAVTRQRLDNAEAAYKVAQAEKDAAEQNVEDTQAQLEQAQQGVNSANAKLAATKSELQQASASGQQTKANRASYAAARADVAQAKAALDNARLQLSYSKIPAPTAGKIGNKTIEVGQKVQAGTPLMAVVGNDYWVTANFKETQLGEIKPGEKVEVKIDAFSERPRVAVGRKGTREPGDKPHGMASQRTFMGTVNSVSPGSGAEFALLPPDNATGNFTKVVQRIPVKIVLDRQSIKGYESRISPGMSVEASVELQQNDSN